MAKAFVDTTVLTDILLKSGSEAGQVARTAMARYDTTELPLYAIKEFKAGPLKNFAWMHNKLASTGSFAQAITALQRMSLTPKRYTTSTAIEALREAALRAQANRETLRELVARYGNDAKQDVVICDQYRLALKATIMKAWRLRHRVTTAVVGSLICYQEAPPVQEKGQIELNPLRCHPDRECCLANELRSKTLEINKLREVLKLQPEKAENQRRGKALRAISRTPNRYFTEEMCRNLGDAYFALFAPLDAVILTTNSKDIEPLASALNKKTATP